MTNIRNIIFSILICVACNVVAMSLDQAREAYQLGDYAEAAPALAAAAEAEPKNALLNQMAGIALFHAGEESRAIPFLRRGQNEANLYLATIEMHKLNFDNADELLDRYEAGFRKAKRGTAPERPEATELRQQIEKGRIMMDRVENIVVIDSIDVDKESFFKAYKLSQSAGNLLPSSVLPKGFDAADPTVVYASENSDIIYWAAPDSLEDYRIVESALLADRTWERPHMFSDILNEGGDANYPFLMSDGVTLYYANNGENSLGGYDIFISRRDGDDFLQPQNLGMPYNSYANDYMLAIDEENGVGWWATDRNSAPDRVTIYVFIPGELRINYPADFPNLESRARLDSYRDTQPAGKDYSSVLKNVELSQRKQQEQKASFHFAVPGRGIYTTLDDFAAGAPRQAMEIYLQSLAKFNTDSRRLAAMRTSYARGQLSLANDILEAEEAIENTRAKLRNDANDIIKAEQAARRH